MQNEEGRMQNSERKRIRRNRRFRGLAQMEKRRAGTQSRNGGTTSAATELKRIGQRGFLRETDLAGAEVEGLDDAAAGEAVNAGEDVLDLELHFLAEDGVGDLDEKNGAADDF